MSGNTGVVNLPTIFWMLCYYFFLISKQVSRSITWNIIYSLTSSQNVKMIVNSRGCSNNLRYWVLNFSSHVSIIEIDLFISPFSVKVEFLLFEYFHWIQRILHSPASSKQSKTFVLLQKIASFSIKFKYPLCVWNVWLKTMDGSLEFSVYIIQWINWMTEMGKGFLIVSFVILNICSK